MTKKIRVALSGSGMKFAAHVGALTAIRDAGYEIVEIIGTSGGSIVAAMYASGMSVEAMKKLTFERDWSSMMNWSPFAVFNNGFCNGKNLLKFLEENTGGKTFGDLPVDLSVVASDVAHQRPIIFSKKMTPKVKVSFACRASASIPFVYTPVRYKNTIAVDGGVVNNLACDRLIVDDIPRLGVQLVSNDLPLRLNSRLGIGTLAMRLIDLMLSACESAHVSAAQMAGAKMAFVETGYANSLDKNMPQQLRQRLFNDGYKATRLALK
ncbi:exotoxin [Collimonas pratensis]|uniref:patatin-like phospholipase family protein n=1 Tax=Collimonas pratensis TaxID=279113 RepID=UPI00143D88EC|nr:patatin-like phospholipase family protein [Collimonas pratensis]NKI68981.1 exotoxin [Collimonas pratensis]